ncbi:MAG: patatin family protein [Bacillales bacterium]|jgi:predicted patatin/cPLA2 family phospholipase|nr:patatin family protein [Bacillales bacterium]
MNNVKKKTALVVEGGAMRGIFATGVLDAFLENDFNPFDICVGVSAGSTTLASYLAGMHKRNYTIFTDYSLRPEFLSFKKFLMGGHYMDLDWLWEITIREMALDLDNIINNKSQFIVGVTDVVTGEKKYIKPIKSNLEDVLKASSSLPIFYRKFVSVDGVKYSDGGITDPIPVKKAYEEGANEIVVIRSRQKEFTMQPESNKLMNRLVFRKYPKIVNAIEQRHKVYQEAIDFMRNPPDGINITEINPPSEFRSARFTKEVEILDADYKLGLESGREIIKNWKR